MLLLGTPGAGKTTMLLRLCRDHGASMIGNDLVVAGGPGQAPEALAGTRYVRLRHASVARVMPELLGLFPGEVPDSWRAKRTLPPDRLGIAPAAGPVPIVAAVFVHVDPRYRELVDEPGDTVVHRLNLYENAVRYIRGGSTPWLAGGRFGPYVPPLDDPAAHTGRTATLERLLERSRYVAGLGRRRRAHRRACPGRRPGRGTGRKERAVSRARVLVVRPEPSRPLGAFYRNLGLTMLATHLAAAGMEPVLADLTFGSWPAALGHGARAAAFSLYIDDFAEGARLAQAARDAGVLPAVGGPHATLLGPDVLKAAPAFAVAGIGDCLPEAMPAIASLAAGRAPDSPVVVTAGDGKARMDALAPDYSVWPDDGRYFPVFPVEFSRGCRQHCPFCTDPVLRGGLAVDPVQRTLGTLRALRGRP